MKKAIKPVVITILAIALVAAVYFIWIRDKSAQVDNPNITPTVAATPGPTEEATAAPVPGDTQEAPALYPAFRRTADGVKYGYIDSTGNFVIQPAYDYAYDFSEGLAVVTSGVNYLVIDPTGKVIFENNNEIRSFHNGFAAFTRDQDGEWLTGFIDRSGKVVIEPGYGHADDFDGDGRTYVILRGYQSYGLIDSTGKVIETYEPDFGEGYIDRFEDGYIIYYNSDSAKYGVIRVTGETVLPSDYSNIVYVGDDLFAVKDLGVESYGTELAPAALCNAKGELLTDYTLYDIGHFEGNYASAADETSVFFIDKEGQIASSLPSYDGVGKITLLSRDLIKAEINGDLAYYRPDNTILWKNDNNLYFDGGITVKQMKFHPLRNVSVNYPQVEGLADETVQRKINEDLETYFTEARANITKEDALTVDDDYSAQLLKNLLIITMTGYDYPAGAAHGMPLREVYFIDTTTGTFYELKDLFKKGSDYKDKINETIHTVIEKAIKDESGMYFEDQFTGISDAQHFYLDGDTLVIYFYPSEIAAYATGFPEFVISFADLTDEIDTGGAFWKAFR